VVGDAIARPLLDEIETGKYDLSGLVTITNGGAPL
jgi:fatty-acyl-CoA synthase